MKFFSKISFPAVVLAVIMLCSYQVNAGDPMRKLGRGIVNVSCGALELPMKVYDVNKDEGGIAGCTYGVLKGLGYFVAREAVGLTEIVTFLIPLPGAVDEPRESGWGYGPLMEPEWVVDPQHDIFNIIYQDLPLD